MTFKYKFSGQEVLYEKIVGFQVDFSIYTYIILNSSIIHGCLVKGSGLFNPLISKDIRLMSWSKL